MSKALYSDEIYRTLKKDYFARKIFKNVVPFDKLPKRPKFPSAYVINTDKSNEKGEHWLAVYYDQNGYCTFFDSFGINPSFYNLEKFLDLTSKGWTWNKDQLQSFNNFTCGYYCIYFILLMSRNIPIEQIIVDFNLKKFNLNDKKIVNIYS